MADTRGVEQDELHKQSIATQINIHIDSITAVVVLTNSTVPRVTVGTNYVLSALSNTFGKTLPNNIAFMLTNITNPLSCNFSQDTLPEVFKHAPQFLLNNPIALQKKYLKLKDSPNMKGRTNLRRGVKAGEEQALEMLVDFFDWLDSREPHPR